MKYRPEIDGLRALAILPVVLFHAGIKVFSGGFVGVDVFFVISGYLITSILLEENSAGIFSLLRFYERRIRRILPALFVMMGVCIPFAWVLLLPAELQSFSKSLVAVPLFVSNVFFRNDGGYFEEASELKPLLHTWSLAVEEQYYLLFPLLLALLWRQGGRTTILVLATITIASLLLAERLSVRNPTAGFFLAPTRVWELGVGSLLSLFLYKAAPHSGGVRAEVLSIFGLVAVLFAIFFIDQSKPFPSFWGLIPVAGTALIITFAYRDTMVGRLLASKPFVAVGLVSYSAYLWHQPLLAFARNYAESIQPVASLAICGVAFAMAAISWKCVENPFRDRTRFSSRQIFALAFVASAFFISYGLSSAYLLRSSPDFGIEARLARELSAGNTVIAEITDERLLAKLRLETHISEPSLIVLGSSRIMQIGKATYGDEVLNLGVSGASIEDIISFLHMLTARFEPRTLVIGIDPWLFNASSGQDRWRTLTPEYHSAIEALNSTTSATGKVRDGAPSPKTDASGNFMSRMANRIYAAVNIRDVIAKDDAPGFKQKIRPDGSIVYNLAYEGKSQEQIERGFPELLGYSMKEYRFSTENERLFETMIRHYKSQFTIVLVLPPYHPGLYRRMQEEKPAILAMEQRFRTIAHKHGIQIVGSYDPSAVGCTPGEFHDGMHPKDECMRRVISDLKKDRAGEYDAR